MSQLLKMIETYDREQEAYIKRLEAQVEQLKEQLNEMSALVASGEALRQRYMLDAICAGAYDKKPTSAEGARDSE